MKVDYDEVAPTYGARYTYDDYAEVEAAIAEIGAGCRDLLEVGCGTGHWLTRLRGEGRRALGVDPSGEMLREGADSLKGRRLIRATAEALPFPDDQFDFVFAINALHHFASIDSSLAEAARVLRPGGRFATVGLDPSAGMDQWYIYDYFPRTLELDRQRYPSRQRISDALGRAGFEDIAASVAQHLPASEPARAYLESDAFHKHTTSQLSLLTEEEFEEGVARIWRDVRASEEAGRSPVITADLRLYVTQGKLRESRTHQA